MSQGFQIGFLYCIFRQRAISKIEIALKYIAFLHSYGACKKGRKEKEGFGRAEMLGGVLLIAVDGMPVVER